MRSGQAEATITLQPPLAEPIRRRALRLGSPDGERSVLLTHLADPVRFPTAALTARYVRRWTVEAHDRDEKTSLDIETFHSQTENGIRQELFAILIVAVIALRLTALMTDPDHPAGVEPQFKHAVITLAQEAFILTPKCPERALMIFTALLNEIARVRYCRPKIPRPSQPRLSKKPINKWQVDKAKSSAVSGNGPVSAAWVHPARRTRFPHPRVPSSGRRFLRRFPTGGGSGERHGPPHAALAALAWATLGRPLTSG